MTRFTLPALLLAVSFVGGLTSPAVAQVTQPGNFVKENLTLDRTGFQRNGRFYRDTTYQLVAGATYQFAVRSNEFTPVLIIRDQQLKIQTIYTNEQNLRTAWVEFIPQVTGNYIMQVTSKDFGASGRYSLSSQVFPALKPGTTTQNSSSPNTGITQKVTVQAGKTYTIQIHNPQFAPVAVLRDKSGKRITDLNPQRQSTITLTYTAAQSEWVLLRVVGHVQSLNPDGSLQNLPLQRSTFTMTVHVR